MKYCLLLICLVLFGISPTLAEEESKRDRILSYYEVNGVLESIGKQIDGMLAQSKRQYSDFPDELWTDGRLNQVFEEYKASLIEAYIDVADENLSDEELDWLIDYMDTEQGQKMFELNQRVRPLYDEATNSVYAPFMEAITALLMEYAQ